MKDGTPAGDVAAPGELAAAPFITEMRGLPQLVLVSRDVAPGTRIIAVRRNIEPMMNTPLPVLPGAINIAKPGGPGDPTATAPPAPSTAPASPTPAAPARQGRSPR
jgi:hypothetical protein